MIKRSRYSTDISFIARETISYFVTSERSEIFTQITYDYSVSRIFLVLLHIFIVISLSILCHLCFQWDKKRYRGTKNDIAGQKTISRDKNDITGHIVFMSPCYRPDKGTSM